MGILPGWAKRVKLTLDSDQIDALLNDFPVPIYLSEASGLTDADVSCVFDELAFSPDDDFTGGNGDPPNTSRWSVIEGSPDVQSNKLYGQTSSGDEYIKSVYVLPSDFDIQVDFEISSLPAIVTSAIVLRVETAAGHFVQATRQYGNPLAAGENHYYTSQLYSGSWTNTGGTTSDNQGKLRIVRSEGVCTQYFWNGSGWTQIGSTHSLSGNVNVKLGFDRGGSNPTLQAYVDNFAINSGFVDWPQGTFPLRKKIAITTGDGVTQCFVEIELWRHSTTQAWLYAKAPQLEDDEDPELYFYYDSTQADNSNYVGDTGDAAAQAVWDSSLQAGYGLGQDPSGGSGCILDSTANLNHGTPGGSMTNGDLVDARFGKGLDLDGANDYIDVPDSASLDITGPLTLEACIKVSHADAYNFILAKNNAPNNKYPVYEFYLWDGKARITLRTAAGVQTGNQAGSADLRDNAWHYIAGVFDGSSLEIYVDGASEGSSAASAPGTSADELTIGARVNVNPGVLEYFYEDVLDCLRISTAARSAAWLKATFHGLFDSLITFGTEELLIEAKDSVHFHTADRPELTAEFVHVKDAIHAHKASRPEVESYEIAVDDSIHSHVADRPALHDEIHAADALHAHTADRPTVATYIAVMDAIHGHYASLPAVTDILTALSTLHAHTASAPALLKTAWAVRSPPATQWTTRRPPDTTWTTRN